MSIDKTIGELLHATDKAMQAKNEDEMLSIIAEVHQNAQTIPQIDDILTARQKQLIWNALHLRLVSLYRSEFMPGDDQRIKELDNLLNIFKQ
jgi:hypothetical protein